MAWSDTRGYARAGRRAGPIILRQGSGRVVSGYAPQTSGSAAPVSTAGPTGQAFGDGVFPDVVAATATRSAHRTWQFSATVS
jgi:hypothetical protein